MYVCMHSIYLRCGVVRNVRPLLKLYTYRTLSRLRCGVVRSCSEGSNQTLATWHGTPDIRVRAVEILLTSCGDCDSDLPEAISERLEVRLQVHLWAQRKNGQYY